MQKRNRFSTAPKDLLDISYVVAVCEGRAPPAPFAYTRISGASQPPIEPEDMETPEACRNIGYTQGFWCQFGGRVELPTPPDGMPRAHLSAFAGGVLDGAEAALMYPLCGGVGGSGGNPGSREPDWQPITDPFSDIHADKDMPGTDPADADLDGDDDDDHTPNGGHDHV